MNLFLYDYAGVPKESILIENKSQNTGQNYEFVQKLLEEKGIAKGKSILIYVRIMSFWQGIKWRILVSKFEYLLSLCFLTATNFWNLGHL